MITECKCGYKGRWNRLGPIYRDAEEKISQDYTCPKCCNLKTGLPERMEIDGNEKDSRNCPGKEAQTEEG